MPEVSSLFAWFFLSVTSNLNVWSTVREGRGGDKEV